ncbi:uncharacterized protein LOC118488892 [Helianthus annuus]|uniref:uncharacterized protein LOC118488892 n=1 Tax=Helianthus annuus TaxID=4232 RepID=UPI0016532030|nr:uncharacterized protein LOC118488892 [Helianthus annuus]
MDEGGGGVGVVLGRERGREKEVSGVVKYGYKTEPFDHHLDTLINLHSRHPPTHSNSPLITTPFRTSHTLIGDSEKTNGEHAVAGEDDRRSDGNLDTPSVSVSRSRSFFWISPIFTRALLQEIATQSMLIDQDSR